MTLTPMNEYPEHHGPNSPHAHAREARSHAPLPSPMPVSDACPAEPAPLPAPIPLPSTIECILALLVSGAVFMTTLDAWLNGEPGWQVGALSVIGWTLASVASVILYAKTRVGTPK